jgi:membrane protease YdiL (CAAX protease family)
MKLQDLTDKDIGSGKESTTIKQRFVVCAFCLAAGLSYRASLWILPISVEMYFLLGLGLSCFFLLCTSLARRIPTLKRYWQIPFAFFVFALAGSLDIIITNRFIVDVIHQTSTPTNPLASTVAGTVLAQLISTLSVIIPILLLTRSSGTGLSSIFIERQTMWKGLRIGVVGFAIFYLLTFSGLLQAIFPNNGVTPSRFLTLTPAILIFVLSNGLREELFFRGLFLKKYGKFLGPATSNLTQATIFTSFHLQVRYTPYLLVFLGITFILGLWLGRLMMESRNILGPSVFHAGADIPIVLGFLSGASP